METYCINCKKKLETKIQVLEKRNKIDCFYEIALFAARKTGPLLKIKAPQFLKALTVLVDSLLNIMKEWVQKFRETRNLKHLYRIELYKIQIRFWKIELMQLLENVNLMEINEH